MLIEQQIEVRTGPLSVLEIVAYEQTGSFAAHPDWGIGFCCLSGSSDPFHCLR